MVLVGGGGRGMSEAFCGLYDQTREKQMPVKKSVKIVGGIFPG